MRLIVSYWLYAAAHTKAVQSARDATRLKGTLVSVGYAGCSGGFLGAAYPPACSSQNAVRRLISATHVTRAALIVCIVSFFPSSSALLLFLSGWCFRAARRNARATSSNEDSFLSHPRTRNGSVMLPLPVRLCRACSSLPPRLSRESSRSPRYQSRRVFSLLFLRACSLFPRPCLHRSSPAPDLPCATGNNACITPASAVARSDTNHPTRKINQSIGPPFCRRRDWSRSTCARCAAYRAEKWAELGSSSSSNTPCDPPGLRRTRRALMPIPRGRATRTSRPRTMLTS